MSEKLDFPWQVTGEWARIWTFWGAGGVAAYRSYSGPIVSGRTWPAVTPVPSNTQALGSVIAMSAFTGLHSYCWPIMAFSGRFTGASRQFTVTSVGSTVRIGSSFAAL